MKTLGWLFVENGYSDPCIDCVGAQPNATINGMSGSVPCSLAPNDPMSLVNVFASLCTWHWEFFDDVNNNRWFLQINPNGPAQFDITILATNSAESFIFSVWNSTINYADLICTGVNLNCSFLVNQIPFGQPGAGSCNIALPPLLVTFGP